MIGYRSTDLTMRSFMEWIDYRSSVQPDAIAYTFLDEGKEESVTYRQLQAHSQRVAAALQKSTNIGDRVLILQQPGLQYIYSYFGCLYAGCVAVPAYPPMTKRYAERIDRIRTDCGATAVLVSEKWAERIRQSMQQDTLTDTMTFIATEPLLEHPALWEARIVPEPQDTAFIQYTSGSTSSPKGVMVSHRNLIHNSEVIRDAFGLSHNSVGLLWLPPYHDMGLIGGILQPVYTGFPMYLMAPGDFIQHPYRWLDYIAKYRVTVTGGPNFAFDLCASRITQEQLERLDLSCWELAFTGAEQIQAQVLRNFTEKFAPCGFRETILYPCYGLAESTLFVTGGPKCSLPVYLRVNREKLQEGTVVPEPLPASEAMEVVGCGESFEGEKLLIVNPETKNICSLGEVGEVWVQSESVATGYLNQQEESEAVFNARAAGTEDGPFLRTGDLGFMYGGQLFIAGRMKEMIIIRGQNYYPTDIEYMVEQLDDRFVQGGCAAFAVTQESGEQLVIVQELSRHYREKSTEQLAQTIREAIASQYGIQAQEIVFIKQGSLGKTSSGKKMRNACQDSFMKGALKVIESHAMQETNQERGNLEDFIKADAEQLLLGDRQQITSYFMQYVKSFLVSRLHIKPERITAESTLPSLGLDSLSSMELQYSLQEDYGIKLGFEELLSQDNSLRGLAADIATRLQSVSGRTAFQPIPRSQSNQMPLSEDQHRLWFVEQMNPGQGLLHIPVALRASGTIDIARLRQSFLQVVNKHETLRTSIRAVNEVLLQSIEQDCPIESAWRFIELDEGSDPDKSVEIIVKEAFHFEDGPLFRFAVIKISPEDTILLFVIHHIIADLKSALMALNEIIAAYGGHEYSDEEQSNVRFIDYLAWNREQLSPEERDDQLHYWKEHLAEAPSVIELPADYDRPAVRSFSGGQQPFEIPAALREQLQSFGMSQGVTPYVVMLSAFAAMLHLVTDSHDIVLGSPVSGRGSRQTENMIGFFAQPLPMRSTMGTNESFSTFAMRMKDVLISAMSRQDVSLSSIVEAVNPRRTASYNPVFQVMFSYLKTSVPDLSPQQFSLAPYGVDVQATEFDLFVTVSEDANNRLLGTFGYSAELFSEVTIGQYVQLYLAVLETVISQPSENLTALKINGIKELKAIKPLKENVVVASTFTAGFIEDSLKFWLQQMAMPSEVSLAPYGQVFQQLLNPQSEFANNRTGFNLLLIRLSDLAGEREPSNPSLSANADSLRSNIDQLLQAIAFYSQHSSASCILCICPEAPELNQVNESLLQSLEEEIVELASKHKAFYPMKAAQLTAGFEIAEYYDSFAERMSHTPYTYAYFSVLGTAVARRIASLLHAPKKVLVLDCDNTIWSGVCAEDGAEGIVLDEKSLYLQQFALEQHRLGMLICLCSKNSENDVWNVFDTRSDMLLRREHIAAYRINWEPKSRNIQQLAEELSLGADSFIMLDDNPVECAEIEANGAEVCVIPVPDTLQQLRSVLEKSWMFDRASVSDEDLSRNRMYRENIDRAKFIEAMEQENLSYANFMSQLQLEIEFMPLESSHAARVSQLTYRTNQFNSTGIRFKEEELLELLQQGRQQCLTVSVKDRFGNYGLVGAIFYEQQQISLVITGWMLSCRVLGKGVEHQILAHLSGIDTSGKTDELVLHFIPTDRNAPFRAFLSGIQDLYRDEEQPAGIEHYHVPVQSAMLAPAAFTTQAAPSRMSASTTANSVAQASAMKSAAVNKLLAQINEVEDLLLYIQKSRTAHVTANSSTEYVAPRTPTERQVAGIWSELLRIETIGIHDNFFFIGGHSLMTHQVIYRIRDVFGIELPMSVLFSQDFTIANVAEAIESQMLAQLGDEEFEALASELNNLTEEQILQLLQEAATD